MQLADMFPGSRLKDALVTRPVPLPDGTTDTDGYIDQAKFHEATASG
ncbi:MULTISPECIES: hypothetical protein [Streptomyces]|uniref:Uncharacterized protein n=2 Tax=Streptomyces TaxID=1883 RepID=A0ABV9J3X3_9ACTN